MVPFVSRLTTVFSHLSSFAEQLHRLQFTSAACDSQNANRHAGVLVGPQRVHTYAGVQEFLGTSVSLPSSDVYVLALGQDIGEERTQCHTNLTYALLIRIYNMRGGVFLHIPHSQQL